MPDEAGSPVLESLRTLEASIAALAAMLALHDQMTRHVREMTERFDRFLADMARDGRKMDRWLAVMRTKVVDFDERVDEILEQEAALERWT